MKFTPRDQLIEILHIINYADDKEKYIQEFEVINHLEATHNLIQQFPIEIRHKIEQDPTVIREYVSAEVYIDQITHIWKRELAKLINAVLPTLTLSQKEKIEQVMNS
jgi:hypothetical protein